MKRNKESGYTFIELMVCIVGLASVLGAIAGLAVLFHFVHKFW